MLGLVFKNGLVDLPSNNFFRFLQIRSFIQDYSCHLFDCQNSQIERSILSRGKMSVLGQGCAELNLAHNMTSDYLQQVWNNDFNLTADETLYVIEPERTSLGYCITCR